MTSFRRRPSGKGDVILIGLALSTVIFLGAALKFRNHPVLVVATASSIGDATGSGATFPPVELTSTTDTAVLSGTATPGAVVRVREVQTVADVSGAWHITVDLIPGRNRFDAVAIGPSGLQVTTSFTVIYTRPLATTLVPTATTEAAPPPVSNATTTATTAARDVPVTISSPLDGEVVTTHRITMSGTATPGARVNAGGTVVTASRNGLWEAVVTLKVGAHQVKVTATTPAGVTSSSITIVYQPPPPETTVPAETTGPTVPPPTTTTLPSDTLP